MPDAKADFAARPGEPAARSFASDNAAGIHPDVLAAIGGANVGTALAYGHDAWTERLKKRLQERFGDEIAIFPVFNGTGANVLSMRSLLDSHHAVLCARSAHLWRDECNAPERFWGAKLIPIAGELGKISPELVREELRGFGVQHHAQPRIISITQPTEVGTLYSRDEIQAIAELAHAHGMFLHVDGARLANAAAAMKLDIGAFGPEMGIDMLSLGGTKLGALAADAVLLFGRARVDAMPFYWKQSMQLASKMRFISAQLSALFDGELWNELAMHANQMAKRLADGLQKLSGVSLEHPVQSNAAFVRFPAEWVEPLQQHCFFHLWEPARHVGRLMCAWDTPPEQVDDFIARAQRLA